MFGLTLEKIKEVYEKHLRNESFKNSIERYIGKETWLHASSAGHCYRKHALKLTKAETGTIDFAALMKMRIGDLIHKDIQEAILKYGDGVIMTEGSVKLPKYHLRGYYDIIEIVGDSIVLVDIKTMGAFPWRRKFGLKKNRDPNPSKKYELQLGTYALGLMEKYDKKISQLKLLYYKKDDSSLKEIIVPLEYIEKAREYWENVERLCIPEPNWDELVPGESYGVPFESWECSGCIYSAVCPSPFKKEE